MYEPKVVEYNNVRVLTTQQLAEAYETDSKTISNNFNRNRDRYVEGKHFICLEGDEKRAFVNHPQIDDGLKKAQKIYLWTEKGTFLHAKSLNTNTAWEVYDRLVDSYFNVREIQVSMKELSPQLQALNMVVESLNRQELDQKRIAAEQERQNKKLEEIEERQTAMADAFQNQPGGDDFRIWVNRCVARIAESPKYDRGFGRSLNYSLAREESYDRLKKKWSCNLSDRVTRARKRAIRVNPGITKTELNAINKLSVIANDKSLRPVYETVIREMMLQYCVE